MKRATVLFLLLLVPVALRSQESSGTRSFVLNHVTVINPTGAPNRDRSVLIRGNRIVAIESADGYGVPLGAQVIEARGKFLIPGLADMHNHLGTGSTLAPPQLEESRRNVSQMLAWGFTTVFSPAAALPTFVALKSATDEASPVPRYFGVGPLFSVKDGHGSQPGISNYLPDTSDEARRRVRESKAAGVDAIKLVYADQTHTGRPPVTVMQPEIMSAIIDEAHKVGLKAYVHAPTLRHAKEVLRAGADGLVHSVVDLPVDDEFIGMMKKNNATYTTTLSLYVALADVAAWVRRLEDLDERKIISKDVYDRFDNLQSLKNDYMLQRLQNLRTNVRSVFDAGILMLAGTDTGNPGVLLGASSVMELVLLVEAGLTPQEALQTATINAAQMLGNDKDLGTVETGKLADLLLIDADPLSDIRNIKKIHRVIKGGVMYDPAELLATNK